MLHNTRVKNIQYAPYLLIYLTAVGLLTSDIYIISLPNIKISFNLSDSQSQFAITIFFLGTIFSSLISGFLSDLFGRRIIVLILLTSLFLGGLFCCLNFHIYEVFLAGRLFQGLGAGGISLVGYTIMQDCLKKEAVSKMITILGIILIFVPTISPLVGGIIMKIEDWSFISIFILILSCFSLLISVLYLPETLEQSSKIHIREVTNDLKQLLTNKTYLFNVLLYPVASIGYWLILTNSAFVFKDQFGITVSTYKYMISLIVLMFAMGMLVSRSVPKILKNACINGAFFCLIGAVCLNGLFMATNAFYFVTGCLIYNFGLGLLYAPSTAAALSAANRIKGLATTIRTVLIMSTSALGASFAQYFNLNNSTNIAQLVFIPLSGIVLFLALKQHQNVKLSQQLSGQP